MNVVKGLGLDMVSKSFEATPEIVVNIRNSAIKTSLIELKAKLLNISTEQVDDKTIVPFCTIEHINDKV